MQVYFPKLFLNIWKNKFCVEYTFDTYKYYSITFDICQSNKSKCYQSINIYTVKTKD